MQYVSANNGLETACASAPCARGRGRERERPRRPRSRLVAINGRIRDNFDPLEVYTDAAVIQRYRLPREAIRQLLGAIRQDLRRATRRSFALTPQVQLLAALRFYATGSFLQVVGDGQGLCKASVCRSVQAVTYSLLRLVPRHVRFHSRDEMGATQENFFRSFRIPQVAGVVDGTLIPTLTPHVDGHVYICRKGYAAVNCQVVRPSGHHPGCRSEMAWKHSRLLRVPRVLHRTAGCSPQGRVAAPRRQWLSA